MPNTILKRWNGTAFEELYPKTTVGQISASGTPNNTTFLRGDGQWVVPTDTGVTGSGTSNLLTYWTGSNTIGSLSTGTYPSLTELSYVKGLSSAAQTQLTNRIPYGSVLMPTNPFGGNALYINSLDNALYAADKKWYVTATIHSKTYLSEAYPKLNPDYYGIYTTTTSNNTTFTITQTPKPSNVVIYSNISGGGTIMTQVVSAPSGNTQYSYNNSTGVITFGAARPDSTIYVYPGPEVKQYLDSPVESTPSASVLFNGDYESNITVAAGKYLKVKITPGNNDYTTFAGFFTYTYGTFYGSYYYDSAPENAYLRTYNYGFPGQTIGWKFQTFGNFIGTNTDASYINSVYNGGDIYRSVMEFIFVAKDAKAAGVSQIDWKLDRPTLSATGATVTKFGTNKLYDILNVGNQTSNNIILNPNGVVTLGGGNVVLTGSSGNVTSYGSFIGGNVRAIASAEAALVNLATGTTISRNVADANPTLIVNQIHASSTGDITRFQFGGANKLEVTKDGFLNQNGTRLFHQTAGTSNTFFGTSSGNLTLTGTSNTAYGNGALTGNTTGSQNVAVGRNSLFTNTTSGAITAVGNESLIFSTGAGNTALGTNSGYTITSGSDNTFIGRNAGLTSQLATAVNSTAIGYQAYTDANNQMVFGNASVTQFKFDRNASAVLNAPIVETTGDIRLPNFSFIRGKKTTGENRVLLGYDGSNNTRLNAEDNDIYFTAGAVELVRFKKDGKVGIGTASAIGRLDIQASRTTAYSASAIVEDFFRVRNLNNGAGANQQTGISLSVSSDNGTSNGVVQLVAVAPTTGASTADFVIQTRNAGTTAERMRILADGKVGIGTASPTHLLHLNGLVGNLNGSSGSLLIATLEAGTDALNARGAGITISQRWATTGGDVVVGGLYGIKTTATGNFGGGVGLYTQPNGSAGLLERLRINHDGLVGINETTISAQLQVKSGATDRVPLIVDTVLNNDRSLQEWKKNGTLTSVIRNDGRFAAIGIGNLDSFNNAGINTSANGVVISRNVADANSSLIVNNVHASSTGNLLNLQASGTDVISFKRDGTLLAPATFTIDPSTHGNATGKVIILGDLQVDGTTTTINSTTLEVDDKNIELSKGAANKAASDGAGITVDLGTDGTASLLYGSTADAFTVNKSLNVLGALNSSSTSANILERTATDTDTPNAVAIFRKTTTADMINGFGSGIAFQIKDNVGVDNNLAFIYGIRSGGDNDGRLSFRTSSAGTHTEKMTILPNGNIGIGTGSPARLFSLVAYANQDGIQIRRSSTTTNDFSTLGFRVSTLDDIQNFAEIRGVRTNRAVNLDHDLSFFTYSNLSLTEKMRIRDDGLVGINTTTPSERLEVVGNAKATTFISTQATGTAPLTVASTTAVTNLNADLLDGNHASAFLLTSAVKEQLKYLYIYGKAQSAITKGQAVQFAGIQGDHILIKAAVPSEINANPDYFIGLAEATLATNDFGYVLTQGELINVNTSTYTAGILWFASGGSTAGALTATEPTGTNAKIQVGAVTKVNATEGIILTRMHIFGVEIADISATGTPSNTTFLRGDGAWATLDNAFTEKTQILTTDSVADLSSTVWTTAFTSPSLDANAYYEIELVGNHFKDTANSSRLEIGFYLNNTDGTPLFTTLGQSYNVSTTTFFTYDIGTSQITGSSSVLYPATTSFINRRPFNARGVLYTGTSAKTLYTQHRVATTITTGSITLGSGTYIKYRRIA